MNRGRMRRNIYLVLLRGVDLVVVALDIVVESACHGLNFHNQIEGRCSFPGSAATIIFIGGGTRQAITIMASWSACKISVRILKELRCRAALHGYEICTPTLWLFFQLCQ